MSEICNECFECKYYWQNNDTGCECQGQGNPCHEFIKVAWNRRDGGQ